MMSLPYVSVQQQPTEYPLQLWYSGIGRMQLGVQVVTPASETEQSRPMTFIQMS
jgi:hypothetical protein